MRVTTVIVLDFAEANLQEIGQCYNLTIDEVKEQIHLGELTLDAIFDSAWRCEEIMDTRFVEDDE
jgi:hypothetical protein